MRDASGGVAGHQNRPAHSGRLNSKRRHSSLQREYLRGGSRVQTQALYLGHMRTSLDHSKPANKTCRHNKFHNRTMRLEFQRQQYSPQHMNRPQQGNEKHTFDDQGSEKKVIIRSFIHLEKNNNNFHTRFHHFRKNRKT